jgi:hypothetical protein
MAARCTNRATFGRARLAFIVSPAVPQGLVFAVATESGILKLYDVRSYDKGPFDTFVVRIAAVW